MLTGFQLNRCRKLLLCLVTLQSTIVLGQNELNHQFGVEQSIVSPINYPQEAFQSKSNGPSLTLESASGKAEIYEGCELAILRVFKPMGQLSQSVTYHISTGGSASNSDYTGMPSIVTIPEGAQSQDYPIEIVNDGWHENEESLWVNLIDASGNLGYAASNALYIHDRPHLDFELKSGLQCVPFEANFVNLSSDVDSVQYLWDFGDGFNSFEENPVHVYEFIGNYNVTLVAMLPGGCADTLMNVKSDIVNTLETPTADFDFVMEDVTICSSHVQFMNLSEGEIETAYTFDDGTVELEDEHPYHQFQTGGNHFVQLNVKNHFGCTDTKMREVFIEPFNVFLPNTFTPDGNEYNNVFNAVVDLDVFEWKLQVKNRLGEVVFVTNDIGVGWDGTTQNGRLAPSGIYVWTVEYVSCEPINPPTLISGYVNLMR